MKEQDIINYKKLSEYLGLHPETIRKNKVPEKYKAKLDKLMLAIKIWKADIDSTK